MAKKNVELIDSEWAILEVVWDIQPCTAPTVQEALVKDKGWAYTIYHGQDHDGSYGQERSLKDREDSQDVSVPVSCYTQKGLQGRNRQGG